MSHAVLADLASLRILKEIFMSEWIKFKGCSWLKKIVVKIFKRRICGMLLRKRGVLFLYQWTKVNIYQSHIFFSFWAAWVSSRCLVKNNHQKHSNIFKVSHKVLLVILYLCHLFPYKESSHSEEGWEKKKYCNMTTSTLRHLEEASSSCCRG